MEYDREEVNYDRDSFVDVLKRDGIDPIEAQYIADRWEKEMED